MQDDNPNQFKPGQSYSPSPAADAPAEQPHASGPNTDAVTRVEAPRAQIGVMQEDLPVPQMPSAVRPPEASNDSQAHTQAEPQPQPEDIDEDPEDDIEDEPEEERDDPHAEQALLSWNAPEFTFTNKPGGWFALLTLFFGILIAIAVLTQQWLSIGLFALMGIALAIYANRKPRTLNYTITTHGVHVGEKAYPFDAFSSFYEVSDYGQRVFELVPAKRLGTLVSLPVQKEQERTLEEMMGSVLPKTPARNDVIDRLFRYLRF